MLEWRRIEIQSKTKLQPADGCSFLFSPFLAYVSRLSCFHTSDAVTRDIATPEESTLLSLNYSNAGEARSTWRFISWVLRSDVAGEGTSGTIVRDTPAE